MILVNLIFEQNMLLYKQSLKPTTKTQGRLGNPEISQIRVGSFIVIFVPERKLNRSVGQWYKNDYETSNSNSGNQDSPTYQTFFVVLVFWNFVYEIVVHFYSHYVLFFDQIYFYCFSEIPYTCKEKVNFEFYRL